MSLASTASSWTNDNIQTRKRIPSIRRTAKLRPYDEQTNLQPYEYISSGSKHKNLKIDTMEETEQHNLSSSARVNDVLNKITNITAENDGNRLADYKPLDNTYLKFVLDNNEKKIGLMTTGTDIPIVEENEYLKSVPPYLFVLPYYYSDFFITVIKKRLKKGESTFLIIPLPTPKFIQIIGE